MGWLQKGEVMANAEAEWEVTGVQSTGGASGHEERKTRQFGNSLREEGEENGRCSDSCLHHAPVMHH